MLEAISDHVWIATPRLDRVLFSNSAFERIYGEPVESLYDDPRSFLALLDPDDRARVSAAASWPEPSPFEDELRVNRRDGATRRVRVRTFPVRGTDGDVSLIAGIAEDITRETELRAELLGTTRRLEDILESTSDAIVALDREWRYTFVNRNAGELFGRAPESLVGRHIWTEYPEGEHQPFAAAYRRVMSTGSPEMVEEYYEPWDRWFENRIFPTDDGIVILFHEVTDQRRAAIAERRHLRLLELANVAVHTVADGTIRFWNLGAEMLYGYSPIDAIGQRLPDLLQTRFPAPREQIVQQLRDTGTWDGTLVHRTRNGRDVTVASHWALHVDPDTGEELVVEVNNDVTALLAAEKEATRLATELNRSERLDALGQLAGGIAHDFNNLLTVILNDLAFAMDHLPAGSQVAADVSDARRAAERAAALTRQLLVFARRDGSAEADVDVDALIADLGTLLERTVGGHIELRLQLACGATVRADPTRLEQVVLNLVINARDALPHGGTITVSTSVVSTDGAGELAPGRHVRLTVRDTGVGMAPDVAARAFEPFFTTKPPGRGTGLGLATVYGVATQAGGTATIASTEGEGTTVDVWLPVADTGPGGDPAEHAGPSQRCVLLVDDEDDVRETARRVLEFGGYRVVEATDADHAQSLWTLHDGEFDVVITDLVMPGSPVVDMIHEFRASRPELPVVMISGFAPEGMPELGSPTAFVNKPFERDLLLATIDRLLAKD